MAHAYQQISVVPGHSPSSDSSASVTSSNVHRPPNQLGQAQSIMADQYYHHQSTISKPSPIYISSSEATHSPSRPLSVTQQYTPSPMSKSVRTGESGVFMQPRSQSSFRMNVFQGQGSRVSGISAEMHTDMDLSILSAEQYPDARYNPAPERNHGLATAISPTGAKGGKGAGRKRRGISDEYEEKSNLKENPRGKKGKGQDNAKQRGRPRLDTEVVTPADRRRAQIRLAQRNYRQRKETTISSLKDRVTQLESSMEGMQAAFIELRDAAASLINNEKSKSSAENMHNMTVILQSASENFFSSAKTAMAHGTSAEQGSSGEENGDVTEDESSSNGRLPKRSKLSPSATSYVAQSNVRTGENTFESGGTIALGYQISFEQCSSVGATVEGGSSFPSKIEDDAENYSMPQSISLTGEGAQNSSVLFSQSQPMVSVPARMSNTIAGFGQTFPFEDLLRPTQNNIKNNTQLNKNDNNHTITETDNRQQRKRKFEDDRHDTTIIPDNYDLITYSRNYSSFTDMAPIFPDSDWSSPSVQYLTPIPNRASSSCPYRELSLSPIPDPLVPLPHPHVQPYPKREGFKVFNPALLTYNIFDRDSFSAKLHRACIERGFVLLTTPDVDRKELARVFAFTFCYITKERATRAITAMVERLQKSGVREKLGQKRLKKSGRSVKSGDYFDIKSDDYFDDREEQNSWRWGGNRYALPRGIDMDEYMRPEEVEQYCIERGIFSGPTGNGHYVHPTKVDSYGWASTSGSSDSGISRGLSNSPSPTISPGKMWQTGENSNRDLQEKQAEAFFTCCEVGGNDYGYSSLESSPTLNHQVARNPFKSTIYIDKFIEELLCMGICLGNSPGFKKIDVATAIARSTIPGTKHSAPSSAVSSAYFMPSPMGNISSSSSAADVGVARHNYDIETSSNHEATVMAMEGIDGGIQGNTMAYSTRGIPAVY